MFGAEHAIVTAVVLAAGSSRRMGENKLLLPLGKETVVRRSVRTAIESGVDQVVVVLGHESGRVARELVGLSCVSVVNPDHEAGVGTSLHLGVTRAARDAGAVVVVLADMPFVTSEMITTLVERYRATGAPLVVSEYGDVEALFAELLATPGERCAKQVVKRHRPEAIVVAWPEEALRDIDVNEDYEHARSQLKGA
jgi:molybdenum cofactor cytidylyltransferase